MNYRLGVLGYLALRELSAVDPRKGSGNAGITDQQLAMRWVQENIYAFGGDPNRVTLIGQSSGGTSILGHLASRSSRGLFHGAISLSASPNITMDRATKEAQDRALLLPHTPCAGMSESKLLDCLYTADAAELDGALPTSYSDFGPFLHKNFDKAYGAEAVEKIRMFYDKYEPAQYGIFALDSLAPQKVGTVALMWDLPFHNWDFMAAVGNWDTFGPLRPSLSIPAFVQSLVAFGVARRLALPEPRSAFHSQPGLEAEVEFVPRRGEVDFFQRHGSARALTFQRPSLGDEGDLRSSLEDGEGDEMLGSFLLVAPCRCWWHAHAADVPLQHQPEELLSSFVEGGEGREAEAQTLGTTAELLAAVGRAREEREELRLALAQQAALAAERELELRLELEQLQEQLAQKVAEDSRPVLPADVQAQIDEAMSFALAEEAKIARAARAHLVEANESL
ncbi:ACHE, partial [Symbiodinium microadriaticum]